MDLAAWLVAGTAVAGLGATYVIDRRQTRHAIRRNFPVYGRLRYAAENLGEYFRQYLFSPNWEERPFDRLTRSWVYRSSKGVSNFVSFGSERIPEFTFRNAAFPKLKEEHTPYPGFTIGIATGPGSCAQPYFARSFFNISGMSYGALSSAAVKALSAGAKMAGVWMATGEGGLSEHHLAGGADIVMQLGTAKYGARHPDGTLNEERIREIAALQQVKAFEVKLAQGAKPGHGGHLPGAKVTAEIARIRGIPQGQDSLSPNRHRDIGNIEELGQAIHRLRSLSGKPVGVKIVVGEEGFLSAWLASCRTNPHYCPDYIHVDGGEGGTGSAPAPLADYVGYPITMALPLVVAEREKAGLTDRIRIFASGKLVTPDKVAWALAHGADAVMSARGFMLSMGCVQAMQCGSGRCPTGVTSSDPRLIKGLDPTDKAVRVSLYAKRVAEEVEMIAHACGVRNAAELRPRHVTDVERGVGGFRPQN